MSLRRLISVLSVLVASSAALAQNKTPTPAPTPAPAAGAEGSAAAPADGSAVQPIEDAPPSDMEGRDENPDAPRGTGEQTTGVVAAPTTTKPSGYPIEQSQRPINLPANMAELSIGPHFQVDPYAGTDALRARYGITKEIQLGLTYVMGGVYNDPATTKKDYKFHVGKAAALDVTVLLTNWLGVRGGVPVYFDPLAVSFMAGAPMKFILNEKLALGGMEDVLNIRISKFPVSLYQDLYNAQGAANEMNGTGQSRGSLRFSGFVEYQYKPQMAILGRVGVETDLGAGGGAGAGTSPSDRGNATFIRAGVQYSPKKYLDVGGTLGFDDLSTPGSFGLAGILAVRI